MSAGETVLHVAAAIRDAAGTNARPGAVAVREGRIVASGAPAAVRRRLGSAPDRECDHGSALVLPAFVNAHAHLDLAHVGPRPFPGTFAEWVRSVITMRAVGAAAIAASVTAGLRASRAAGVGWIGDIAATDAAVDARATAPPDAVVPGVAWLEVFGIGRRSTVGTDDALTRLEALRARYPRRDDLRIDLQPHAPYSAGFALFEAAAAVGAPTTHLAETVEELEFVRTAGGPLQDLLAAVGAWDDSIRGTGPTPIRALEPVLRRARWVLAHCNYVDDEDLAVLARSPVAVAYCPVASDYFGHRGHRYREMRARGALVCLGTDSILCQPATERQPHGILAQCRHLFARDGTPAEILLAMATVDGARALLLERGAATLCPGAPARLVAAPIDERDEADPLEQVLAERSGELRPIAD